MMPQGAINKPGISAGVSFVEGVEPNVLRIKCAMKVQNAQLALLAEAALEALQPLPPDLQREVALALAYDEFDGNLWLTYRDGRVIANIDAWDLYCSASDPSAVSLVLLSYTKAIDLVVIDCMHWDRLEYQCRTSSYRAIIPDVILEHTTKLLVSPDICVLLYGELLRKDEFGEIDIFGGRELPSDSFQT